MCSSARCRWPRPSPPHPPPPLLLCRCSSAHPLRPASLVAALPLCCSLSGRSSGPRGAPAACLHRRTPPPPHVPQVLLRRTKNNPVLIGDPGVGKTAVAEGIAQLIVSPAAPPGLAGRALIAVDVGSLVAGTQYRGAFEERLTVRLGGGASGRPGHMRQPASHGAPCGWPACSCSLLAARPWPGQAWQGACRPGRLVLAAHPPAVPCPALPCPALSLCCGRCTWLLGG